MKGKGESFLVPVCLDAGDGALNYNPIGICLR